MLPLDPFDAFTVALYLICLMFTSPSPSANPRPRTAAVVEGTGGGASRQKVGRRRCSGRSSGGGVGEGSR